MTANHAARPSEASLITGTSNWLQLFNEGAPAGPSGGGGAPASATAPVSAPASPPPAAPLAPAAEPAATSPLRGGFRPPTGPNPLLGAIAPAPATAPAPAAAPAAPVQTTGIPPVQGQPPIPPQQAPAAQVQPPPAATQPPPATEYLDFGGDRIAVPADPTLAQALRQAHTHYRNQQGTLTRTQQQLADVTRRFSAQGQAPAAPGGQPAGQAGAQPQAAQPFDPRAAIKEAAAKVDADALRDALYENPAQALGNIMEQVLAPVVDGLSKDFQSQLQQATAQANSFVEEQRTAEAYTTEMETMTARPDLFPDLDAMRQVMGQVIGDPNFAHLLNGPNPMQTVYYLARGLSGRGSTAAPAAPSAPAPVTVDSVMADQALVSQLVQHPQLRDQIVRSYLEALREGQPPVRLAAPTGGAPLATPPARPTNIREAGQMARQFLLNQGQ